MVSELRQYKLQFEGLFSESTIPMWFYDKKSLKFLAVNRAAEKHYGFSEKEFLKMTIRDMRPPEEIPNLLKQVSRKRKGLEVSGPWKHLKKDGSLMYVEIASRDQKFAGRDARLVAVHDITKQILLQEEVRKNEIKFSSLIKNSTDIITLLDRDGTCLFMSDSIKGILGYEPDEITGKNIFEFIHPEDLERVFAIFMEGIEIPDFITTIEYRFRSKTGEWKFFESTGKNLLHLPEISAVVTNSRDITVRKNLELRLRNKVRDLDAFIYRTSHDLKEPHASIEGILNLARSEISGTPYAHYCDMMAKTTRKLGEILSNLEAISKGEPAEMRIEKINLKNILNDILTRFQKTITEKRITVKSTINTPTDLMFDPQLLTIILQHLMKNAVLYHIPDPSSFVRVGLTTDAEILTLEVEDNGPGIPPEYHEKVFLPFFRASEEIPGSGLGLFIIRYIAEKMNGTVRLESMPGKGTRVTVVMPAINDTPPFPPLDRGGRETNPL